MKDGNETRQAAEGGVFSSGMDMLVRSLRAAFILLVILIAVLLVWFFTFSGFFVVKPDTAVLTFQFGKFQKQYTESWHWVFPYPVGSTVEIPTSPQSITTDSFMPANRQLITDRKASKDASKEAYKPGVDGFLITADACILHTAWSLTYRIVNPKLYYEKCMTPQAPKDPDTEITDEATGFKGSRGPRTLIRDVFDNSILRVTALWKANDIILSREGSVLRYTNAVESEVRRRVADLDIGVQVESVNLTIKSPPPSTIDAFDEVLRAEMEAGAEEKKARTYATEQDALGQSEKGEILAQARNYKSRIVSEIRAEAEYFERILAEYRKNKDAVLVSLFTQMVSESMADVKDKFVVNALPGGRQELRLKLNPEPAAMGKPAEEDNTTSKEAGK